jgi:transposase
MPKRIQYQLNDNELKALEDVQRRDGNPRVRQRATGIRLLHLGKKPQEVAELLNVSLGTVYNWHASWRQAGVAGLADEVRSGRPRLGNEDYCAKLEEVMVTDPSALGYGFTCWTIERLMAHLAKVTGISMSDETFRQLLAAQAYVYRRPKHDLKPLQDAQARTTAQALLEELKKKPKSVRSNYSLWTKRP